MVDRGVSGKVDYLRAGPENGPIDAIVYSIKGPDIRIRKMEFSGASPAEIEALHAAATRLEGSDYSRSLLRVQEDKGVSPDLSGARLPEEQLRRSAGKSR